MREYSLNLKGTPCPINFVRTKLKLESMELNTILEVILDDGEAVTSVSQSIEEEGHEIYSRTQNSDQSWTITIKKLI